MLILFQWDQININHILNVSINSLWSDTATWSSVFSAPEFMMQFVKSSKEKKTEVRKVDKWPQKGD